MKKTLAFDIVLLFIGVAFAPSLYADVEIMSEQKELIEIPIQICGLREIKDYAVKLSEEDANSLDILFDDMHHRLNASGPRGETISIFKYAVVELDKLGLLVGYNVEEVQELVIENQYEDSKCFLYGEFTNSTLFDLIPTIVNFMPSILRIFLFPIWILHTMFSTINHMSFFGFISIGETLYHNDDRPTEYYYSKGWIRTKGIDGVKECNGSFLGDIMELPFPFADLLSYFNYNIGGIGFTGLKIRNNIIGYAQEVKIRKPQE
jgi:hypothetical protein